MTGKSSETSGSTNGLQSEVLAASTHAGGVEAITANKTSLQAFFRRSYGDSYLGDYNFMRDYIERADAVVSLGEMDDPRAAALLRAGRITAIATNPEQADGVPRRQAMAGLLVACQVADPATWMTIDERSTRMREAAQLAGMRELTNEARLIERLDQFGELDLHIVTPTDAGLMVARVDSAHGPDYVQHAWGWQD